jgi:hypothetical protein
MSTKHTNDEQTINLTRRGLMRAAGAAGAGAVTLRAVDDTALDPTGEADANPFVVGVGIVVGAGIVAAAITGNGGGGRSPEDAAEETQADILQEQAYQAALKTSQYNKRTILSQDALISEDGLNALNGIEQMAYEEGVAAAIDAMNNGATQAQTLTNAKTAAQEVIAPTQELILNEWNVSLKELDNFVQQLKDLGAYSNQIQSLWSDFSDGDYAISEDLRLGTGQANLIDGTTIDPVRRILSTQENSTGDILGKFDPVSGSFNNGDPKKPAQIQVNSGSGNNVRYLDFNDWNNAWNKTTAAWSSVEAELETFVNDVYSSWQSGEISKDEFLTSRMLAQQAAEDSTTPRAVSDLIAMGVETDLSRKVAISYDEDGVSWTVAGQMAATKSPSGGFEVGQSYVPNATDQDGNKLIGSVYMVAQQNEVVGNWPDSGVTAGVDGGIITLTKEPLEGYVYNVTTTADETIRVTYDEWVQNDSGNWEYDASGRLETPITEVGGIQLQPAAVTSTETRYIRENIDQQFTVEEIVNEETGEEFQKVEFEQQTASAPTDYRTPEDFRQQAQRNQELYEELLKRFEEVENSGGGGLFGGGPNFPTIPGLGAAGTIAAAFLALFGLGQLAN